MSENERRLTFTIKACPFCGGKAVIQGARYQHGRDGFRVGCDMTLCPGEHGVCDRDLHVAIDNWNKRAS